MNMHFYESLEFVPAGSRPVVACNMVTSLDGKVTLDGNQPASLGSRFDFMTMGIIRSHFDAVLAGGNTIRLHPYYLGVPINLEDVRQQKGLDAQPLTVLLTRSGNLDPKSPVFTKAPRPPIIITSAEGERNMVSFVKANAHIEVIENATPDCIVTLLQQEYQVDRLLLEGGPSVNYQFMESKLLDELFLTLHPSLIGKSTDLTIAMGKNALEQAESISLISSKQHGDELFLRYRIKW